MNPYRKMFILAFMMVFFALFTLELSPLAAQGKYSVLTGKVIGIRGKMWLDVENEKDNVVVNFRIGRKTVYVPHRFPTPGEKVKVEYLTQKGIPVAYTVTILEGSK